MSETAGITVLHVDDQPEFADLTAEMLEREDDRLSVETATNASEGLDRLADSEIDCIVSDYDMPGPNGIDFLETVREDHPNLPFILFTGKGSEEIASDAISAGATDYVGKQPGSDQYELLVNRIQNAVEQYRASQRAAELDHIRTITSDVNQALVRAESRVDAETRVCEIMTDSEPYLFAWIGEVDTETARVEPRTSAGVEEGYLDEITVTADDASTGRGPIGTAIRERRVVVFQDVTENAEFEPWRADALERGYRAVAAIPLSHADTLYGVLTVYAERPGAFNDSEQQLLTELGNNIARAFDSFDVRDRLRRERDRRRALFENAPDPVIAGTITGDGDTHEISDVNDTFEDVFGYETAEIVGRDVADVVVPDDRRESHETFRQRAAAGEPTVTDVTRMTADGPREFLLTVIPYGADGSRADGWYAWYTDISERKQRERRVREQRERLQRREEKLIRLRDYTEELMYAETPSETTTVALRAIDELLGFDLGAVFTQSSTQEGVLEMVDVLDRPRMEKMYGGVPAFFRDAPAGTHSALAWDVFETGESIFINDTAESDELSWKSPFGSLMMYPVGSHGVVLLAATTLEAFTETEEILLDLLANALDTAFDRHEREEELRRQRDELARQNERLDEFVSVVSHDLRNPLTVLDDSLELAAETGDREHFDRCRRSVERMSRLIEDLLSLARDGASIEEIEAVSLPAVCEESWGTVATASATLGIETERVVRADRSRLKQLLENLFRNAVQHGGDSVTITVGDTEDGFYVADDGPGIPADERENAFGIGYSTDGEGAGFGLNIVEQVVDTHGWDVRVTESEAGGARFEITSVTVVK